MHPDLSIMQEIANIGAGHAATALSLMFSARVDMDPPEVVSVSLNEAVAFLNANDDTVSAALLALEGELSGLVVFVTSDHEAILADLGVEDMPAVDVLAETGNIVAARLADAIGSMTSLTGHPLPPAAGLAARTSVVEAILSMTAVVEPLVVARTRMEVGDDVKAELFFFPDPDTVGAIGSLA